jgi:fatty-acyl-CoA synthase
MAPLCSQFSIDYLTPRDFARRPTQWLNLISRNRATIAFSPSFGYELASRRAANQVPADLDLSSWRHAGIGGDMIRPDVLDRFSEAFEHAGFDRKAFIPSYGMAEVCLAITFCPHGTGVRTDAIDRAALADGQRAQPATDPSDTHRARRFVVCGKVLPGHRLDVRGDNGRLLADREVGRIYVKGPSVMPGYFAEPDATREVLSDDGWLDTGDLGYTLDGEIVVTGRAKDLIIVNGPAGHRMGNRGARSGQERRRGGLFRRHRRRRASRGRRAGARVECGGPSGLGWRRGRCSARDDGGRLRRGAGATDAGPAHDVVG